MTEPHNQKGQISPLAMWLIAGMGSLLLGVGTWTVAQLDDVEQATQDNTNRVIVTEVKIENVEMDIREIKEDVRANRTLLERINSKL